MTARGLPDWNTVATVQDKHFTKACEVLGEFGPVKRTAYYNVVVARIDDVPRFLDSLIEWFGRYPELPAVFGRISPLEHCFAFQDAAEFEAKAKAAALGFVPQLANKTFHVRMYRRGFKGRLTSPDEERFLDGALLAALETAGTPGRITFDDPDAIIVVETVDNRAGMALWPREHLRRYPFLKAD
jgi:tRNA(Ser,Leu) C12 N-acetylase TAN1